ncbi:putative protease inhibitor [Clavispora lusitaniae]|uniref:Protease inhibitor n=2 Tax=Clavispora lusitaniae TaxID=36911 RepID=A0AA91Q3E5_CLALS|nr:Peptidase inhibitor I9 family protein [Clavispora lusitaniae]OVF10062.1 putative protease inhibitor [Clavispora lusitaniae]QFZ29753.1 putative protease inhibitor [Clavispora lusitaniae]QFZ35403.1 putative protease inhibitor [Clavispora lusitaniae]QFZ41097.1 putative protease inhibitor [Clavispora lusitaniae]
MTEHKSFIVTLKDTASDADLSAVKKQISSIGGKIVDEFALIKGFVAELPLVHAETIEKEPSVLSVEANKEVKIQ